MHLFWSISTSLTLLSVGVAACARAQCQTTIQLEQQTCLPTYIGTKVKAKRSWVLLRQPLNQAWLISPSFHEELPHIWPAHIDWILYWNDFSAIWQWEKLRAAMQTHVVCVSHQLDACWQEAASEDSISDNPWQFSPVQWLGHILLWCSFRLSGHQPRWIKDTSRLVKPSREIEDQYLDGTWAAWGRINNNAERSHFHGSFIYWSDWR